MNAAITNFLNHLCYHTDFDGVSLDEITLESCRYELQELKKESDPEDLPLLNIITPEVLHQEYIRLWKAQHKITERVVEK